MNKAEFIWMNGKLVKWDDAKIHVLSHGLHYGTGVFEGIRFYDTEDGTAIFRLEDHVERLFHSWHILGFKMPFSRKQISKAIIQVVKANKLKDGYIRPIVFLGYGKMGVSPTGAKIDVAIAAWKWGSYFGKKAQEKGLRVIISSYSKYTPNAVMTKAKTTGEYITNAVAKHDAEVLGFDETILLSHEGHVTEGSGENIFIVRNGVLITPPKGSVLEGITRESVMKIAKDIGIEVKEDRLTRDQLYIADEAFFTGTAAEITPITEIDGRRIGTGRIGPLTKQLKNAYFNAARGKDEFYKKWLSYV